ncbi:hypothetical protein HYPSUDRAFT_90655 [Hypholoma sublateritium FD-334 SS-4]|uniref:Uncharacterized protein n=1 Tax=Hypholoma sublateritium (strain FD-334 SS-4) TaxID=945553 RepID=A0A0D2PB07_HYPSF|nr:hypothetical protein HYPSUDRAFT_90655 [Hypholoma sublateritium FD-334 SS-4]
MAQVIGFRFNAANLCRLAKSMRGIECTSLLGAVGVIFREFEDRPDGFRIELIPVPPGDPSGEEVNIIFIIWVSSKQKPLSFKKLRQLPRMQEAKGFLRGFGITEIDDWKLIRTYLD